MFSCIDVAEKAGLTFKRREGAEYLYLCPIHNDHHPSLKVNQKKDIWMCGPCNASGNAWQLLAFVCNCDPNDRDAVLEQAKALGLVSNNVSRSKSQVVATYDYTDAYGKLLFQVVRIDGHFKSCRRECDLTKHFYQRVPNGNSGWKSKSGCMDKVERVPFRLEKIRSVDSLFWVEGEKDVLTLERLGFTATTSPQGAYSTKHLPQVARYLKRTHQVTIIPDNDVPGKNYARKVAALLHGKVAEVRILELPGVQEKGDVSDWVKGKDPEQAAEELSHLADAAPEWMPESDQPTEITDVPQLWDICSVEDWPAEPLEWFIEGIIPKGGIGFLSGAPKDGKSLLALDLMVHLAHGKN